MADPNVITAIKTELVNRMDKLERDGDINLNASIVLGGIVEWMATYADELTEQESNDG